MSNYVIQPQTKNKIIDQEGNTLTIIETTNKIITTKIKLKPEDEEIINKNIKEIKKLQEQKNTYAKNIEEYKTPKMTPILSIIILITIFILSKGILNNEIEAISRFYIFLKLSGLIMFVGITADTLIKLIDEKNKKILKETNDELENYMARLSLIYEKLIANSKTTIKEYELPKQIENIEDIYKYIKEKELLIKPIKKVPALCIPKNLTAEAKIEILKTLKQRMLYEQEQARINPNIKTLNKKPNTKVKTLKGNPNNLKI